MVGEPGLTKIHGEFSKVFYTLKQVHDNERQLMKKCRQLNDELESNVEKANRVLMLTEEGRMANDEQRKVKKYYHRNQIVFNRMRIWLFCSRDLDLKPMTLIRVFDLASVKT